MVLEINRKSGIPLYMQLKQQIAEQISSGIWRSGYKLPTEREMALMVSVSRNTISMAYRELELEGLLVSHQGRGTFVADNGKSEDTDRLLELVDAALNEAAQQGLSYDEFLALAERRSREVKRLLHDIKIAFIECNREQVDYFAKQLEFDSGVSVAPLVLGEIRSDIERFRRELESVDFVVTTFFHISEVKEIVGEMDKQIIGIALDPQMETMVRIAHFEKGKSVGLVCLSHNFAEKVINSIEGAGIDYLYIKYTTSQSSQDVIEFIRSCEYVLTSPGRKREVKQLVQDNVDVVEFVYKPDLGSVNMLRATVLEYQQRDKRRE